jgi:hypothetical protein
MRLAVEISALVLLILALAACGGTTTRTVTVAVTGPTQTTTVTSTVTVYPQPPPKPKPKPKPKARPTGLHFSGNGSKDLPPITVPHNSTLHWQASGGYFFVSDRGGGAVNILSEANSGSTYVAAGRYQLVIAAVGDWSITIG